MQDASNVPDSPTVAITEVLENSAGTARPEFMVLLIPLLNRTIEEGMHSAILGVHMDRKLTWKAYIDAKCASVQVRLYTFYPILNPRKALTRNKAAVLSSGLGHKVDTVMNNGKEPESPSELENYEDNGVEDKGLLVYTMLIRPIITYAAPTWAHVAKMHARHLQIIQNKCLRIAADAHRYCSFADLHRKLKIEKLVEYFMKLAQKFYTDCANNANA
ncbi:hypothetical protein PR048_007724 [Dryococelus australis]|uniref:Uncharacterized protein n=1 Tax=Dryococelus australis TaxID=614101 RepID=A0ABQ9HV20_9NEOP|nr:hypothetical protein PR048_007724 [Dryococelus australis]